MQSSATEDWVAETLPSWRQQFWLGVVDPLPWLVKPYLWKKCLRDAVCLERMHEAFDKGLMEYGTCLLDLPSWSAAGAVAP